MTKILWIFTWELEILKISTFNGSFCAKYIRLDLKSYKEVIFYDTEEWCKFEKLACNFENDMINMANFHQSTWKFQNWELDGILLSKVENIQA